MTKTINFSTRLAGYLLAATALLALGSFVAGPVRVEAVPYSTNFAEKTFTPSLTYSVADSTALSYSVAVGRCDRQRNQATCYFNLDLGVAYDPGPAAGEVFVCGLPFKGARTYSQSVALPAAYLRLPTGATGFSATIPPGGTCLRLETDTAGSASVALTAGQVLTASVLTPAFSYITDP